MRVARLVPEPVPHFGHSILRISTGCADDTLHLPARERKYIPTKLDVPTYEVIRHLPGSTLGLWPNAHQGDWLLPRDAGRRAQRTRRRPSSEAASSLAKSPRHARSHHCSLRPSVVPGLFAAMMLWIKTLSCSGERGRLIPQLLLCGRCAAREGRIAAQPALRGHPVQRRRAD